MRAKGITYDTGFVRDGRNSRDRVLEDGHGTAYPDMPWEPKAAFTAVADHYEHAAGTPASAVTTKVHRAR